MELQSFSENAQLGGTNEKLSTSACSSFVSSWWLLSPCTSLRSAHYNHCLRTCVARNRELFCANVVMSCSFVGIGASKRTWSIKSSREVRTFRTCVQAAQRKVTTTGCLEQAYCVEKTVSSWFLWNLLFVLRCCTVLCVFLWPTAALRARVASRWAPCIIYRTIRTRRECNPTVLIYHI